MTPQARLQAAIEVLDAVLDGRPVEAALTGWARSHRFAGSGDRAALRDLVFDALRCRRSFAALGGGLTGRGLILGSQRAAGTDVAALFSGTGHAPAAIGPGDVGRVPGPLEALDCPDWLAEPLTSALGAEFSAVMQALQRRAPVFLRVNARRSDVAQAVNALAAEGISARPHGLARHAVEVTDNARKIIASQAYATGLVELQDAASQAVVEALPLQDGDRVLDFCAGGGGKTMALAARGDLALWAHDANPTRMRDLPVRAARAKVRVTMTENPEKTAPYDLILTDVPCSGSGSWRRDPAGKWALTPARLAELVALQAQILDRTAPMVARSGVLAYATCSMLEAENAGQIAAFLGRTVGWHLQSQRNFTPSQGGDGFFLAILTRKMPEFAQP